MRRIGNTVRRPSKALTAVWGKISDVIEGASTADLSAGFEELTVEKKVRKDRAGCWIRTLSRNESTELFRGEGESWKWGTDGSARPSSAKWGKKMMVVSAVVGPKRLRTVSSLLSHTIFQAEATAIAYQTELMTEKTSNVVYSDHLNSLRLLADLRNSTTSSHKMRKMPGRSIYKWIWSNVKERGNEVSFEHVKSHTNARDTGSKINESADREASNNTEEERTLMPQSVTPTWELDDYAVFSEGWGWIETSVSEFVQKKLVRDKADEMDKDIKYKSRMSTSVYDPRPHPAFPYQKSLGGYAATV
jgi:hypothetical protein